MPIVQADLKIYFPTLREYYAMFEILKEHQYIQDVNVIEKEGHSSIVISRNLLIKKGESR